LYLVLIVGGYMLVLFVERVLFSVHDAAHAHTHTGIVSRVNSGELLLATPAPAPAAPAQRGEEGEGHHGHAHAEGAASASAPAGGTPGVVTRRQAAAIAAEQLQKPLLPAGGGDDGLPHGHSHSHSHGGGGRGHSHVCRHGHEGPAPGHGDLRQGIVLVVAMSVHTFLECMALGLMVS
jgi:hypothetical protein